MRIVHLNYVFEPGLSPDETIDRYRTLRCVSEAQAARGDRVFVLLRHHSNGEIKRNGVLYVYREDNTHSPLARPWTYPKDLHRIAALLRPDVAQVHSLKFYTQVRMLRAALGQSVPIVVQHHAGRPAALPWLFLQRYSMKSVNGFIFNGDVNAEEWLNADVIPNWEDIYEVPEGSVDFAPVPRDTASRITGMKGNPIVLWVGRLHEAKDPLTVLDGFELYAREQTNAHLYLVYRAGPLNAVVADRIASSPLLRQAVTPLGERPHAELAPYYSSADVFVTAAPYEGSNYALIEALSCGVLSACSDIGPHRFLTRNGKFAEYFAPGDATACAVAIGAAAARARDAHREEIAGFFQEELSFDAIARKLGDVYKAVRV